MSMGLPVIPAQRRCVRSLRATVASWPSVEGAESDGDGGATTPRRSTRAEEGILSVDPGGGGDAAPQNVEKGVVLIEQKGPAWTEIVWDEVMGG